MVENLAGVSASEATFLSAKSFSCLHHDTVFFLSIMYWDKMPSCIFVHGCRSNANPIETASFLKDLISFIFATHAEFATDGSLCT